MIARPPSRTRLLAALTFFALSGCVVPPEGAQDTADLAVETETEADPFADRFLIQIEVDGLTDMVWAEEQNGRAIVAGDMDMGPVDEARWGRGQLVLDSSRRWPDQDVGYWVDPNMDPDVLEDIDKAAAMLSSFLPFSLYPSMSCPTSEIGCIRFEVGSSSPGCSSGVGRSETGANVVIADDCSLNGLHHELLHTMGMYHEQARDDQANFVQYCGPSSNEYGSNGNWEIQPDGSDGLSWLDWDSIMLYGTLHHSVSDSGDTPVLIRKNALTMLQGRAGDTALGWQVFSETVDFDSEFIAFQCMDFGLDGYRFLDFDGDGRTDIYRDDPWEVQYSADPDAGFQPIASSGYRANQLLFGDFDGDGEADILRRSGSRYYVSWSGVSGWGSPWVSGVPTGARSLARLKVADINGDGVDDIVWDGTGGGTGSGNGWKVLLGTPSRSPTTFWYGIPGEPLVDWDDNDVLFLDYDGDGDSDLVRRVNNIWYWYLNEWNAFGGGFMLAAMDTTADAGLDQMRVVDVDQDGADEVIYLTEDTDVTGCLGGRDGWWIADGPNFSPDLWICRSRLPDMALVGFGEFTGDGVADAVAYGFFERQSAGNYPDHPHSPDDLWELARMNGDLWAVAAVSKPGSFATASLWSAVRTSSVPVTDAVFGDFNGDDELDWLDADGSEWSVAWGPGQSELQRFSGQAPLHSSPNVGGELRVGRFDPFDGDDVVEMDPNGELHLWGGAAADEGTFGAIPGTIDEVFVGDFDDDGWHDLLSTNESSSGRLKALLSGGQPLSNKLGSPWSAWSTVCSACWGWAADRIAIGDFNGDGADDVFTDRWVPGYGRWYYRNLAANRRVALRYGVSEMVGDLRFADFEADGRTDVMRKLGSRWQYVDNGSGSWRTLGSSSRPLSATRIVDLNLNGHHDILTNFDSW